MKHFGMKQEKVEEITQFEQEVWMRFQQFKVPVIQLLRDTPKEAVCQVFEKVNTGGVALTVFELVTAIFAADDFPLREDWEQRKSRLHDQDVLSDMGGTEFLQVVTLLGGGTETVKRMGNRGDLRPIYLNSRTVRYRCSEVEDYLRQGGV